MLLKVKFKVLVFQPILSGNVAELLYVLLLGTKILISYEISMEIVRFIKLVMFCI